MRPIIRKMEPLADVISLLRPRVIGTKILQAAGRWGLHRAQTPYAGFALVLEGQCWAVVDGAQPLRLDTGDFLLIPAVHGITLASNPDSDVVSLDAQPPLACQMGSAWYGSRGVDADFKQIGGFFELDRANLDLLARFLPALIHIRASDPAKGRLSRTIDLLVEEALSDRAGRDLIVNRLVEIVLVEALRSRSESFDAVQKPGLLLGLADPALARALRKLHGEIARPWTVEELAKEAGLSRSVFSERFRQKVGLPPMQYLIDWRIALAKGMLAEDVLALESIAIAVGYQSSSAFSTAFRREVGTSPGAFVKASGVGKEPTS